jgi:hypothetical protein
MINKEVVICLNLKRKQSLKMILLEQTGVIEVLKKKLKAEKLEKY